MIVLLVGCSEKSILPGMPKDGKGKIKVMAYHEQTFQQKFGDLFAVNFPEVEIEVVGKDFLRDRSPEENPGDKLIDFIEKENPDLILLDTEQVAPLVDKGKLLQLDAVMKQEQFDTTGIPALTMDFFRQLGDGHIYTLSPTYDVSAIYYNEDLFREQGIEPPRNQMTWEELFLLSSRFGQLSTEQNPMYGISTLFSNPMDILMNVAQTKELRIIDNGAEELLLNSESWKEAYRLVTDSIKANGLYMADETVESISVNDTMFAKRQSAMTIAHATSTKMLQGDSSFKVGLVTMPINPTNPEVSPFMSFDNMYAINANSPNKRIAWELLSHMCSPEMAKTFISGFSISLPIRNEGITEINGLPAEPFTILKPYAGGDSGWGILDKIKATPEFQGQVYDSMNQALVSIIKEDVTVDDALNAMQKELQERFELEKRK